MCAALPDKYDFFCDGPVCKKGADNIYSWRITSQIIYIIVVGLTRLNYRFGNFLPQRRINNNSFKFRWLRIKLNSYLAAAWVGCNQEAFGFQVWVYVYCPDIDIIQENIVFIFGCVLKCQQDISL